LVTGLSSPMSGNLANVALSPARCRTGSVAAAGDGTSPSMGEGSGECTDRFIPSRASSNLNFSLPVGNATSTNTGTGNALVSPHRISSRGNHFQDGNRRITTTTTAPSTASRMLQLDVDLSTMAPANSFGATMMGGTSSTQDNTASIGSGNDREQTSISPTFSEDGASTAESAAERHDATNRQPLLYDALLRSEMLGENIDPTMSLQSPTTSSNYTTYSPSRRGTSGSAVVTPFRERSNNLRFVSPRQMHNNGLFNRVGGNENRATSIVNSFNITPVSMSSNQRLNLAPYADHRKRKIPKVPTKVLDAPSLQDDFYLNLVDWSSQNFLAVGLGSSVYLWSASTSRVTKLCDFSATEDIVTSVAWSEGGRHLAVGTTQGEVQLWDASQQQRVRSMEGHTARVGSLSWKKAGSGQHYLASGSRDRLIHIRDPRSEKPYEMSLYAHKQEVCGLKWSHDERGMLASGGNDNKLLVWDVTKHNQPIHTFADHTAAVKAIAWSPHQHGLLASGGGTADRCIRFWNCLTGEGISCLDTGSQCCNLAWSENCNEIVSTHGYSLNQIVVWKYPTMTKMATLTGHTYRVLYLAVSPDGSTIVTGAGDETLRFWQVFPGPQKENSSGGGSLFPSMPGSVLR